MRRASILDPPDPASILSPLGRGGGDSRYVVECSSGPILVVGRTMLPKARSRHGEGNVDGAMGPRPRSCHDKLRAAMAGRVIEGVQPKRVAVPGCSGRQLWVVEVDLAVETAR